MAPSFSRIADSAPLSADKFADVPSALRDRLNTDYEHACSKYTKAALEAPAASYGTQYELKKAHISIIPKREREITTIKIGIAFAESANISLVGFVIDNLDIDLKTLSALRCDGSPAELQRANPDFLDCHAVEKGCLSWGLDSFGCLSLCILAKGDADKLGREAYFVQRVYASGEDGPRAADVSPSTEQPEPALRSSFSFSLKLPDGLAKENEKAEEAEEENRLDWMMEAAAPPGKKALTFEEYQEEFWKSHGGKPDLDKRSTKRY